MNDEEKEAATLAIKQYIDAAHEAVARLEERLGLKRNYFTGLTQNSDDWTFVLKVAALTEAAVNELVMAYFGVPEADDFLAFSPLTGRASKMKMLVKLELLDNGDMHFVDRVFRIRNRFAHSIKNVDKSIDQIVTTFEDSKAWREGITSYSVFGITRKESKMIIAGGLLHLLAIVSMQIDLAPRSRLNREEARKNKEVADLNALMLTLSNSFLKKSTDERS